MPVETRRGEEQYQKHNIFFIENHPPHVCKLLTLPTLSFRKYTTDVRCPGKFVREREKSYCECVKIHHVGHVL